MKMVYDFNVQNLRPQNFQGVNHASFKLHHTLTLINVTTLDYFLLDIIL